MLYEESIGDEFINACKDKWDNIKTAFLDDPCLVWFHPDWQNFSSHRFVYSTLQPDKNPTLNTAMTREMQGGQYKFKTKEKPLALCQIPYPAVLVDIRFTCTLTFVKVLQVVGPLIKTATTVGGYISLGSPIVMPSDSSLAMTETSHPPPPSSANHALEYDIVHWRNKWLIDAKYWSHLGTDTCYGPLIHKYNKILFKFFKTNPLPTGEIFPQNVSNFRYRHDPI